MSKREFKVGDRVRMVSGFNAGAIGTVKHVREDNDTFAIEFDEAFGGHDCNGHAKGEHGWWCFANNIELVSNT